MIISAQEFLDTFEERQKKLLERQPKCVCCKVPLQSFLTGYYPSEKGKVCEDCYFDLLGEEIEKHPILHRKVRGC